MTLKVIYRVLKPGCREDEGQSSRTKDNCSVLSIGCSTNAKDCSLRFRLDARQVGACLGSWTMLVISAFP